MFVSIVDVLFEVNSSWGKIEELLRVKLSGHAEIGVRRLDGK
jgi:hypothetical protein